MGRDGAAMGLSSAAIRELALYVGNARDGRSVWCVTANLVGDYGGCHA